MVVEGVWVQLDKGTSRVFVRTGHDVFIDGKPVVTVQTMKVALKREMSRKLENIAIEDMRISFGQIAFDDEAALLEQLLAQPQCRSGNAGRKNSPLILSIHQSTGNFPFKLFPMISTVRL